MIDDGDEPVEAQPERGPYVALGFWLCLILSAALYAVCSLSPRIVEWTALQDRYIENQMELVDLQGQIKHIERVVVAIETDRDFAERMARSEFGGAATAGERIPLPQGLEYDPRNPRNGERPEAAGRPWYLPVMCGVAGDEDLRLRGLVAAALLMLFAFVLLQERSLGILRIPRRVAWRVASRYVIDRDSR